jgi:cell division protease FtsH
VQIVIPLPDEQGRAEIVAVHLRGVPIASAGERAQACAVVAGVTRGALPGAWARRMCAFA